MKWAKYTGTTPHVLPDGRIMQPDHTAVEVDEEHSEIAPLFDVGLLIDAEEVQPERGPSHKELLDRAKELEIEGAGSGYLRSKESLAEAIAKAEVEREETDDDTEGES